MSSFVSSAADNVLPFGPALSSISLLQYNCSSSVDIFPSGWTHSPLMAATLMYQNEHQLQPPSKGSSPLKLKPDKASAGSLPKGQQHEQASPQPPQVVAFATTQGTPKASQGTPTASPRGASKERSLVLTSSPTTHRNSSSRVQGTKLPRRTLRTVRGWRSVDKRGAGAVQEDDEIQEVDKSDIFQESKAGDASHEDRKVHEEDTSAAQIEAGLLGRKIKSKLSPEVPEFIPGPALTALTATSNPQDSSKGLKTQKLSADVPEFVPMSAVGYQTPGLASTSVQDSVAALVSSSAASLPLSPSALSNGTSMSTRTANLAPLNRSGVSTLAGARLSAVLSHTSPSFMPATTSGHITAATVLAVTSQGGLGTPGQGVTAILIPNTVLQGSSLLLSSLPVSNTGAHSPDAVSVQGLGLLNDPTAGFSSEGPSGPVVAPLPLQVAESQIPVKGTGKRRIPGVSQSSSEAAKIFSSAAAKSKPENAAYSKSRAFGSSGGTNQVSLPSAFVSSNSAVAAMTGSSKLSSSSPAFIPSAFLGSSTDGGLQAENPSTGMISGLTARGQGRAGRSVSYTAGSQESTAKVARVRIVENAKDSSRLSPEAPAFTPSKATASRKVGNREPLGIKLPAEDALLDDEGVLGIASPKVPGKKVGDGWGSKLSPSAPEFSPWAEERGLNGRGPNTSTSESEGGASTEETARVPRAPTKQELQVIVKLVGELKESRGEELKSREESKTLADRNKGVERLRRALLQHLAQQALLHTSEAEGRQDEGMCPTKESRSSSLVNMSPDPSCRPGTTEGPSQGPSLSAAAKEFVPLTGGMELMAEMASLDPDTLSTSSCDPLLLMDSLAKAAAQSRSCKKSSRFFPTSAGDTLTELENPATESKADDTVWQAAVPERTSLAVPTSKSRDGLIPSKTTSLPWTMALLTSLRASPPAPSSHDASLSWGSEKGCQVQAPPEQSLSSAWEGVLGAWARSDNGAEGLLGLFEQHVGDGDEPCAPLDIPMRRLADLVLSADADCVDQSPRSQDFSEIEQFLPPDLLEPT